MMRRPWVVGVEVPGGGIGEGRHGRAAGERQTDRQTETERERERDAHTRKTRVKFAVTSSSGLAQLLFHRYSLTHSNP